VTAIVAPRARVADSSTATPSSCGSGRTDSGPVVARSEGAKSAPPQTAPPSGPTLVMRRLLVAPELPNGTPQTTITRSPTPTKPSI